MTHFLAKFYRQSLRTSGLLLIGAASIKNAYAITASDFYDVNMQPWSSGEAYLGFLGEPEQVVTITAPSILPNFSALHLGYTGAGTLEVMNGSTSSVEILHLGDTSTGSGSLKLSGSGTVFKVNSQLNFGSGNSEIRVENGAELTVDYITANSGAILNPTILVSGENSRFANYTSNSTPISLNFRIEDRASFDFSGDLMDSNITIVDEAKASFDMVTLRRSDLVMGSGASLNAALSTPIVELLQSSFSMSGGATAETDLIISKGDGARRSRISVSGIGTQLQSSFLRSEQTDIYVSAGARLNELEYSSDISLLDNSTLSISDGGQVYAGVLEAKSSEILLMGEGSKLTNRLSTSFADNVSFSIGSHAQFQTGDFSASDSTIFVSGPGAYFIEEKGVTSFRSSTVTLDEGGRMRSSSIYLFDHSEIRLQGVTDYSPEIEDTLLDTPEISGKDGSKLVFAHHRPIEDPYYLTYTPSDSTKVLAGTEAGEPITLSGDLGLAFENGATAITQATQIRGGVVVNGGHLITQNELALGNSTLYVESGALQVDGKLLVGDFHWSGGELWLPLENEAPLNVKQGKTIVRYVYPSPGPVYQLLGEGSFTAAGDAGQFVFDASVVEVGSYELIRYTTTNFDVSKALASVRGGNIVDFNHSFELKNNALWINIDSITASGAWLQNSKPVYIPTSATFLVSGQARTGAGNEANTIYALTFEDQSSLELFGDLTITSGQIKTLGSASLSGETLIAPNGLYFSGFGHLEINSDVDLQGDIVFGESSVAFNGAVSASNLLVSESGILGGSGVINNDVTNKGTVAPGNSPGTLTIVGDYTQTRTGVFDLEIESTQSFDRLLVSGKAELDGKLQARPYNQPRLSRGTSYRFLVAEEVTGKFSDVDLLRSNLPFLVEYGDDHVTLHLLNANYTRAARNENEYSVAKALNRSVRGLNGEYQSEVLALDVLDEAGLRQAFHQIMPTYTEAALSSAVETSQNHGSQLHQYLSARRLADRIRPSKADAELSSDTSSAKGAKQVQSPDPVEVSRGPKWNVWHQTSGLFSEGGVSLNSSEQFDSGTIMVGADHALCDHVSLGIFTSYQAAWSDFQNQGSIDSEAIRFGLYATVDVGGFYANVAAGYGHLDYDFRRPIQINTFSRTARSDTKGDEFFGLFGVGYDQRVGNWTFGPQFSLQYSHIGLDKHSERGAGLYNLAVDRATTESLRTQIGGRIAYEYRLNEKITLIPEFRAFWQHEFLNGDDPLRAELESGEDFRYHPSSRGNTDTLFIGAGLGVRVGERVYGNVYYNTDFGRSESNHTFSVNLTFKF